MGDEYNEMIETVLSMMESIDPPTISGEAWVASESAVSGGDIVLLGLLTVAIVSGMAAVWVVGDTR